MSAPIFFRDSLETRAAPLRFRQIGNPFAFLNDVGIDAMLDEVRKGHNLVEIAESLNVSIGVLLRWIDCEGHVQVFDDAFQFSAEGHLAYASKAIRDAENEFQLKKAKELATHGRFMASKLNRNKYGNEAAKPNTGNVVQFVLHMGTATPPQRIDVIDGEIIAPSHEINGIINDESGFTMLAEPDTWKELMFQTPAGVVPHDPTGPFEPEPFRPYFEDMPVYLKERA
jgi:hypothetical protein